MSLFFRDRSYTRSHTLRPGSHFHLDINDVLETGPVRGSGVEIGRATLICVTVGCAAAWITGEPPASPTHERRVSRTVSVRTFPPVVPSLKLVTLVHLVNVLPQSSIPRQNEVVFFGSDSEIDVVYVVLQDDSRRVGGDLDQHVCLLGEHLAHFIKS